MHAPSETPGHESAPATGTDALAIAFPLAGAATRIFIARASPLPPDNLATFLLAGLVQDLAVGLTLSLLARLLRRGGIPAWLATTAAILPFVLLLAGHAGWAEAIVYFGHPPRREDIAVGLRADFIARSADPGSLFRLAGFVAMGCAAALLLAPVIRKRRRWRGLRILLATVAALVLTAGGHRFAPTPTANGVLLAALDLSREPLPVDEQGRATVPPPRQPATAIRDLALGRLPGTWLSDEFPLATSVPPRSPASPHLPQGLRPNMVFVLLEGVRAREISCYGGPVPGLTPNLDRLAHEGVRVEHAFSPGTCTPQGEIAYWYGLLATPGSLLPVQNPETSLYGLPEILKANGWRSLLWISNTDQSFYRRDRFYLPRGFQMIDGRDFPRDDVRTNWGFSDKALARRAVAALDQTPEPFAAMVLTISNHHPFQVPGDAATVAPVKGVEQRGFFLPAPGLPMAGRHTLPMMKTIHYTDEAVGDFFRLARTKEWAKRTIFVISGDHGLPIVPVGGLTSAHELAELRHRVPLIFWSPLLEGGRVVEGPASLADVPPTLIGLLGLHGPLGFAGDDLLDPRIDFRARPLPLYDQEARRVTILKDGLAYDATVEPPRTSADWALERGALFDLDHDPHGRTDLSGPLASKMNELRKAAETFIDVYPWIALAGRTGIPPRLRPVPPLK